MSLLIACRDCGAIQQLPPTPDRGHIECWRCGRVLEHKTGRSLDGALACSVAALLLLFPTNLMNLMTVYLPGLPQTTHLFSGVMVFWRQGWPLAAALLALFGVFLPFLHFGLLSVTLGAIRWGVRAPWVGVAFRYCELLDLWAMSDVLLIGAGIGYGRVLSQVKVVIEPGGWCLVGAAMLTMLVRATLDRQAVWRRLEMPPHHARRDSIACTSCDLVLPAAAEGGRCPRCAARVYRRYPSSVKKCWALTLTTWVLTPIAYAFPMSQFWKLGTQQSNTVVHGILLLFEHGFWYFGVMIFLVSVVFPFTKLVGLTWFLLSVRYHWPDRLRFKTGLYRFVDEVGRWSVLDPFTVLVFTPMVQLGQLGHFNVKGGTEAFLATVVLSMLAARVFDPRLLWDQAEAAPEARRRAREPEAVAAG